VAISDLARSILSIAQTFNNQELSPDSHTPAKSRLTAICAALSHHTPSDASLTALQHALKSLLSRLSPRRHCSESHCTTPQSPAPANLPTCQAAYANDLLANHRSNIVSAATGSSCGTCASASGSVPFPCPCPIATLQLDVAVPPRLPGLPRLPRRPLAARLTMCPALSNATNATFPAPLPAALVHPATFPSDAVKLCTAARA
jgi:hypothetical protein